MNLYGCLPASYLPSHSTLTYWAQAATLANLPNTESALTSASLALGLKKSQLPISLSEMLQKSRSSASLRSSDDLGASLRMAVRVPPPHSTEAAATTLSHHGHLQLHAHLQHQHQQRQQQQNQHHHHHPHRPYSSTPPPLGNGLAPLQALCDSDVSAFTATSSSASSTASGDSKGGLKFGMSRILSDDFGKSKNEKENTFKLSSVPDSCRSLPLCPCNSPACTAYARPPSPYHRGSLPSLSAVHALQPPSYPMSSSADALPGPYSILSTDNSSVNQPKRKRSWSRAVFSNLQRKGLEKRFEVQKYVTKPDRRQLAAMLGLTDAQVKVWFQNRRMKWRHAQQQGEKDKQTQQQDDQHTSGHTVQEATKQGGGNGGDKTTTQVTHTTNDDVTGRSTGSRDGSEPATSSSAESIVTSPGLVSDQPRVSSPVMVTGRKDETSHNEIGSRFYTKVCAPEHCISLAAPFDTRNELSIEVARCHGLAPGHFDDVKPQTRDVTTSQLRHNTHSPCSCHNDPFDRTLPLDSKMDSDDESRSGLEIDSDVDVNDDEDDDNDNKQTMTHRVDVDDIDNSEQFDDDASMKEIDVDN